MAGNAFSIELAFHHHLRGDTRVVSTRLVQRAVAFHAVIADQGIDHHLVETVTHVQRASHVGRWDHNAVRFAVALWREIAALFPVLIPALFDLIRLVGLIHVPLLS